MGWFVLGMVCGAGGEGGGCCRVRVGVGGDAGRLAERAAALDSAYRRMMAERVRARRATPRAMACRAPLRQQPEKSSTDPAPPHPRPAPPARAALRPPPPSSPRGGALRPPWAVEWRQSRPSSPPAAGCAPRGASPGCGRTWLRPHMAAAAHGPSRPQPSAAAPRGRTLLRMQRRALRMQRGALRRPPSTRQAAEPVRACYPSLGHTAFCSSQCSSSRAHARGPSRRPTRPAHKT